MTICCLLHAGASLLIVNGVLTDLQNFDLYSLVDSIRKEVCPHYSYFPADCHLD